MLMMNGKKNSIPGKYAVERYPALKYVPAVFAPWKRQVLEQRKKDIEMYTTLIKDVKSRREKGTIPDCFATHLLDEQQGLSMTDLEVAYAAGTPFGAGIETVSISLITASLGRSLDNSRVLTVAKTSLRDP